MDDNKVLNVEEETPSEIKDTPKKKKHKKWPIIVAISVGTPILLVVVILIVLLATITDKNRSTYVRSEATYTEIINKNIIKGFKDTSTTGKFTFSLDESDINDLLYDAKEAIKSPYVENIYYKRSGGKHTFFVDIGNIPLKTRASVETSIEEGANHTVNLKIDKIKLGNLAAPKKVVNMIYDYSDDLNKEFEKNKLPIKLLKDKKCFQVDPLGYISNFPMDGTSGIFWDLIQDNKDIVSVDSENLGLIVDLSKFRSPGDLSVKTYEGDTPNFYNSLKSNFEDESAGAKFLSGETVTAYQIAADDFNHLLQKSLPTDKKEEITSPLTTDKAVFNLVGTNTTFLDEGKIDVATIYSLNGYLIDIHLGASLTDSSNTYVDAAFAISTKVRIGTYEYDGASNKFVSTFTDELGKTFKKVEDSQGTFFTYDENQKALRINLEDMNDTFAAPLKDASKSVLVNKDTQTIDFTIKKN